MKKLLLTAAFSLVGVIAVTAQATKQSPAENTHQPTHNQNQQMQIQTTDPNAVSNRQKTQTVRPSSVRNETTVTTTDPNQELIKEERKSKKKLKLDN